MAAELVLTSESESDIADAYSWYEARRIGLGEEFLSSLDAYLECVRRQFLKWVPTMSLFADAWCGAFRTLSFINTQTE